MKVFETELELSLSLLTTGQLVRTKGAVTSTDGDSTLYQVLATGTGVTLANGNVAVPYADVSHKNLLIGNFRINQREVSGTVVLSAGEYGHDRFRAGSGGCTYTFATSANVTTVTISAGTLEQEVEGLNIESGTHVLSWAGTAQGQIDGGGFAASGVTATLTGGTNAIVEFDTGTLSTTRLNAGSIPSDDEVLINKELSSCQRYYWQGSPDFSDYYYGTIGLIAMTSGGFDFPTTMRISPTMVQLDAGAASSCTFEDAPASVNNFRQRVTVDATGRYRLTETEYSANAEL